MNPRWLVEFTTHYGRPYEGVSTALATCYAQDAVSRGRVRRSRAISQSSARTARPSHSLFLLSRCLGP